MMFLPEFSHVSYSYHSMLLHLKWLVPLFCQREILLLIVGFQCPSISTGERETSSLRSVLLRTFQLSCCIFYESWFYGFFSFRRMANLYNVWGDSLTFISSLLNDAFLFLFHGCSLFVLFFKFYLPFDELLGISMVYHQSCLCYTYVYLSSLLCVELCYN